MKHPISLPLQALLFRSLLIVALFTLSSTLRAQQWKWAIDAGGGGNVDYNKAIVTDSDSNVYCAGTFSGTNVVFGTQTIPTTNSNIYGFIAKYDRFGNFIWVQVVSHNMDDLTIDRMVINPQDELYVLGTTKGGILTFGNGITLQSNNSSTGLFIAKFNTSGQAQWARTPQTSGSSVFTTGGLALDATGNLYFNGTFNSSGSFPVVINGITYTLGGASIFIAKYDSAGSLTWFKNTPNTGSGTRKAFGLSVVGRQLYMSGTLGFAQATFDTITAGHPQKWCSYVTRFDVDGHVHWARTYTGGESYLNDISADAHNNVFAVGQHRGTLRFGNDSVVSNGTVNTDALILCLDTLGNHKWLSLSGNTETDWVRAVFADGLGNAYAAGYVRGAVNFMGTPVTSSTMHADLFVAKISGTQPLKWIKMGGGPMNDYALSVYAEPHSKRIYVGGYYWLTSTYGSSVLNDVGNGDMMLIQLADTTFDVSATVQSSCSNACNGSIAVVTNGNPILYEWSNTPDNVSHQENLCPGTYSLRVTNSNGGVVELDIQVTPRSQTPVVFDPGIPALCISAEPVLLNGGSPSGGIYAADGSETTIFDPAGAGAGIHELSYSYTFENGCSDTVFHAITVHPLPILTATVIEPVCISAEPFALNSIAPADGTYSGAGISNNTFDPTVAGAGNHELIYTYTDSQGCTDTAVQTLTVHPLPELTYAEISGICIHAPAIDLSAATPAGGTYSGNGVNGQTFDPADAGTGNQLITYTYTDANNCTHTVSEILVVHPLPVLSYTGSNEACLNAPAFVLNATPAGGTYSGDGVTDQIFDPALANAGSHEISYFYTSADGCSETIVQAITVHALPTATFVVADAAMCEDAAAFSLSGGSPAGGSYFIDDIPALIFDPQQTGVGAHSVSYLYTDENGCSDTVRESLEVFSLPAVSYVEASDHACSGDAAFALSQGLPTGGSYSGNGVSNGIFDPAGLTTGWQVITYSYTDDAGCSAQAQDSILFEECLGLDPLSNGFAVHISPNPAEDIVHISTGNIIAASLRLLDAKGTLIWEKRPQETDFLLDLTPLMHGIYILQVELQGKMEVFKLAKSI